MAMDRKYRYALEKAGLTEAEVDLRFRNIDRRMKDLHIGDRLYEIDKEQYVGWAYNILVNTPFYEWTVTSIVDEEYGIIGVTNKKYGTSNEKGYKEKSILNLNKFEEGFEMCQCVFKESEWKHKGFSDDFLDHYPNYWNSDNKPLTFYCSDMYRKDYLIEHGIPDFKVSVLIDAKKQEINFSIDVSPDFREQAIELIAIDPQYKKWSLIADDKKSYQIADGFSRNVNTAMALRSQSIGDLITAQMVKVAYGTVKHKWKLNYLFPICNFEVPRKCYYWSLPLFNFLSYKPCKCFDGNYDSSRSDGTLELRRAAGLMISGNQHIYEDNRNGDYMHIWNEISTVIIEACEKRNFKNSSVYDFASQIIEKGAP